MLCMCMRLLVHANDVIIVHSGDVQCKTEDSP